MAELPANSRLLYRICTEKSRVEFGKYAGLTVGDILKIDEVYVAWLYFNRGTFSLKAELLEQLGITPIVKPGTSEAAWKEWRRAYGEQFTEDEKIHGRFVLAAKKRAYHKAMLAEAREAERYTKGQLQAINHGHGSGKK